MFKFFTNYFKFDFYVRYSLSKLQGYININEQDKNIICQNTVCALSNVYSQY